MLKGSYDDYGYAAGANDFQKDIKTSRWCNPSIYPALPLLSYQYRSDNRDNANTAHKSRPGFLQ